MVDRVPGNPLADVWNEMAAKRGRDWAFPNLVGQHTAVVGCDVSRLGLALAPRLRAVIPRIDWLARTIRAAEGTVVWTHFAVDAFDGPEGAVLGETELGKLRPRLSDASWMDVNEGVQGATIDRRIARAGYTAFTTEGSHLPHILKDMQIDTVVLVGAETDGAVDANARDACSAGFRVLIASDCCASSDEDAHNASLRALHRRFGDVRPADEIVSELRRNIVG